MILYSQRDPRWANHPLGWGPADGTLGQYGCFDTVLAMIANDSGHQVDPPSIDELFTNAHIFLRDPTGAFDLLPDDALVRAYAGDYEEHGYWGWRADLVASASQAQARMRSYGSQPGSCPRTSCLLTRLTAG